MLDHVLDKGIVIDAWVRLSLGGISLITVEARVLVASIETYVKHSKTVSRLGPLASPSSSHPNGPGVARAKIPA